MSTEDNKAVVRRFVDEIFVRGNQAAVDELVADDFVSHTWPSTGDGKADLKRAIERLRTGLAYVNFTVDDLIAEGDRVAARLTASARQVGEIMGQPAGGRAYAIGEIHIFRIEDRRVAEHWHQYDALGMQRQLGGGHGGTTMTEGRVEYLNPDGLARNPAFTQVAVVSGPVRTIYVGGQDAVTPDGQIVGKGDIAGQTEQILKNIETALAAAGAGLEHIVKWNLLVVEGQPLEPGFAVFQRIWGDRPNPPLITGAVVSRLAHPDFLVEMDAIAVVPA